MRGLRARPLHLHGLVAVLCLALVTVGALVWPTSGLPEDLPGWFPVHALVHWDAAWYGAIARDGYWLHAGAQSPVAFFPLFPLSIRALAWLGLSRWTAGWLLALGAGLGALAVFRRWAARLAPEAAGSAVWVLALYPFAVFLYGAIYSDAFFLLCAVGAFLALESDRPVVAGVLGALATLCRPVAPAVVLGLVARSVERRRRAGERVRAIDLVPAIAVLGLLGYMAFLQLRFGDALAFAHAQAAPGWEQPPGWQAWLKVVWFRTLFPRVAPLVAVRLGGHALVTVLAVALLWPTFKRLGWGYGVYTLCAVGIPAVSSKDFMSMGRYLLAAFPLFLVVELLLRERPRLRPWYLAASGAILAVLAVAYGADAYVA